MLGLYDLFLFDASIVEFEIKIFFINENPYVNC